MTDEEDPFGGGIELEFDAMEARRQAAEVKPAEPVFADPGPPDDFPEFTDEAFNAPPPQPTAPVDTSDLVGGALPEKMAPKKYTQEDLQGYTRPPPPMWRSIAIVLGFLIVGGGFLTFWYRHELFPADPNEIVTHISEGENNELIFKGETYQGEFVLDQELEGTANQVVQAIMPEMPFVTHQMVLVTGDFADPAVVTIGEISNNRVQFESTVTKPKGAATFVNLIPANAQALADINKIGKSQFVVLVGDEVKTMLTDPTGKITLSNSKLSRVIRVHEVLFDQEPTPEE